MSLHRAERGLAVPQSQGRLGLQAQLTLSFSGSTCSFSQRSLDGWEVFLMLSRFLHLLAMGTDLGLPMRGCAGKSSQATPAPPAPPYQPQQELGAALGTTQGCWHPQGGADIGELEQGKQQGQRRSPRICVLEELGVTPAGNGMGVQPQGSTSEGCSHPAGDARTLELCSGCGIME